MDRKIFLFLSCSRHFLFSKRLTLCYSEKTKLPLFYFMKHIFLFLLLASCLACRKEPDPIMEDLAFISANTSNTSTVLLKNGIFRNEVHPTQGEVKIFRRGEERILVFENFRTDNGPDLFVYLSPSKTNTQAENLGMLRSTSGTFSYTIPANVNLDTHQYVIVWCKRFAVLFGSAELK